jgi:hypothetical protein
MAWEVSLHHEVAAWYLALCKSNPETADLIEDAIDQLAAEGPALRRPLADRVKGSRYHNMKELRPPSSGTTEIRLLFAFDPRREAIPVADERFMRHLLELEAEDGEKR